MSIEEIIKGLEAQAQHSEALSRAPGNKALSVAYMKRSVLFREAAAALLRTHQDNQPNEPLTLEELNGMIGQPVWVESPGVSREISGRWTIVEAVSVEERTLYTKSDYTCRFYGVVWVAYRRPPKEETV